MIEHTPGPWKYLGRVTTRNDDTMEWPTVECAFRRYIKPEGRTSDECEANARLIAAAPEMYELIQGLVRAWEYDAQFIPCDTEAASELSNKLARLAAQAAPLLTKIEGGEE